MFLLVIDSAHTYRPERGSVVGWMFGVAYNVLAAGRRRARREMAATRRIAGRRLLEPAGIARIEERIDAENAAREIHRALRRPRPDGPAAGTRRRRRSRRDRGGGRGTRKGWRHGSRRSDWSTGRRWRARTTTSRCIPSTSGRGRPSSPPYR
ncbi:hypothetical protein ACQP2E_11780 [Actinoplanes sp. CA-015351]|uniref:hypothetical protein n=1 Tax=Actinoplanes sp. CA-015351 TaxID=3239897 RepID=UPI003D99FBE3